METDANTAVADMNENVSKAAMIFGILTSKILVGATVIGFSRSGNYMNKEYLDNDSKVYSIVDVTINDVEMMMIQSQAKDPFQMRSVLKQIKQVGLNQILFVMKILEHQGNDFGKISTATDLFLIILRGNLAFQSQKRDTTFSKLLKDDQKNLLKTVFQLCKGNLQDEQKQAGVFNGTVTDEDQYWLPDGYKTRIPLSFLKRVGIFEIPPTNFDQLTLTAQHLSFVEFFASVGILLNLDIKGSL